MSAKSSSDNTTEDLLSKHNLLSRMLVATGGSEHSLSALRFALHLAQNTSKKVDALIVEDLLFSPGAVYAHGETLTKLVQKAERLANRAWTDIERKLRHIAEDHGVSIEIARQTGHVTDVLLDASQNYSLILLGKRGGRPDVKEMLGTNAELIARRTDKPVLLAPNKFHAPTRIIVAYGGMEMGTHVLEMGFTIGAALDLPVEILIAAPDEHSQTDIRQRAEQCHNCDRFTTRFDYDTADPATAILRRATPDTLMIMGAYGHSRIHRIVLGSTTEQVIHKYEGPLLLSHK